MIRLSWSTFRDRWQLFVGAVVAVSLGVALVQASLLILVAAADPAIPTGLARHDELVVRDAYLGAVSLAGIIMAITTFVAVFVVGSTFAFTVAQRRRDLALLRLTGATPRQVRRLLLAEALILGLIGTAIGIGLGMIVALVEIRMFLRFGFVPEGFTAPWRPWIIAVSAGVGVGVAILGCLAASRRAGRVRALDALRQDGTAERVMTTSRWVIGIGTGLGAGGFIISTATAQGVRAMDAAVPACLLSVVALSALSPFVVPLAGTVLDRAARTLRPHSRLSELVLSNLRAGVRRTASTAAPIILLVGLVVGLAGTVQIIDAGRRAEAERTVRGELVVSSAARIGDALAAIDGVRTASEEAPLLVEMPENDIDEATFTTVEALAVDSVSYPTFHSLREGPDALARLQGGAVAFDRGYASALHAQIGDTVPVRIDGRTHHLEVVALLSETMTGPDVLLPIDLAPATGVEYRYLVQPEADAPALELAQRITNRWASSESDSPLLNVQDRDTWIRQDIAERRQVSQNLIVAILGLATLYIVIAVINAVVIAGADRREELATARLTGLSRTDVIRASVWESLAVAAIGVALGGAAATTTLVGVTSGVSDVVGTPVVTIPWLLIGATILGTTLIVTVTTAATAAATTSRSAIAVAGAKQ